MAGYIMKITLEDTHPPVWRRVIIPESISFYELHRVLQAVFHWEEEHLHAFTFPETQACVVMEGEEDGETASAETQIMADGFLGLCKYVRYTYDFGDDWRHKIVFEKEDPDYNFRYAQVLKYKGDSYAEDSGGVWGNAEERIIFDIEAVNQRLEKMCFAVMEETQESRELLETVLLEKSIKKLAKMSKNSLEKLVLEMTQKLATRNWELPEDSEMARRVKQWNAVYEGSLRTGKAKLMKNVSRKSSIALLTQIGEKNSRDYCKYVGAAVPESGDKELCVQTVWRELQLHPEYLAYIFNPHELEELGKLFQLPNGICDRLPEQDMVSKALALGFFDLSEEKINGNRYIALHQTEDAKELLNQYSQKEWKRISKEHMQRIEQCNQILHLYNMLELDILAEKYQKHFDASVSREEIFRCIYLSGTFCKELQTATTAEGTAYAAEYYIDMNRMLQAQRDEAADYEYRDFSPEEWKRSSYGYGELYPVWGEYYDYMQSGSLSEEQTELWLQRDYENVKNGAGAEALWENVRKSGMLTSIDSYVSFWHYFLGACLTTGLPQYKGYSREEYAKRKEIPVTELGIYNDFKSSEKLTPKSHICELPLEQQLHIYEIVRKPADREARIALEKLVQELTVRNYELEYILAGAFLNEEDYGKAEKLLKDIRKEYPKDETVKIIIDNIKQITQLPQFPEDDELSIWDMMEGRMPKSDVETYRREQPKIGRNDPCPCGSGKKYKKCCMNR